MSGKLLVVGDSFCSRYLQQARKIKATKRNSYLWEIPEYKYWFEYLGEKLNLDIINQSFNGAGNQQIFDNTLYALNTSDDIEFAIICWSEFNRVDLPFTNTGGRDSIHINLTLENETYESSEKYNTLFTDDKLFDTKCMIDKFLNYSVAIDNLLKHKEIKNIQAFSVRPYPEGSKKDRKQPLTILKEYMNHELFDKLNEENFFMFPGTKELGGGNFYELIGRYWNDNWKEYVLNSNDDNLANEGWIIDGHPNAKGHKLIFDKICSFMLDK